MEVNNNYLQQWTKTTSTGCLSGPTATFTTLTDIPNNSSLLENRDHLSSLPLCNTTASANAVRGMGMYSLTDMQLSEEDFDEGSGSFDDLDCVSEDSEQECNPENVVLEVQGSFRSRGDQPLVSKPIGSQDNYFEGCKEGRILPENGGSLPMTVDICRESDTTQSSSNDFVSRNFVLTSKENNPVSVCIDFRQEHATVTSNCTLKGVKNMETSLTTPAKQSCEGQPSPAVITKATCSSFTPQASTISSCISVSNRSEETIKGIREECIKNSLLPSLWDSNICNDLPRPVINPTDDVWVPWKSSTEWGRNQPHQTLLVPAEYADQHVFKLAQQEALLERGPCSSSVFASNSPRSVETMESFSTRERRCSSGYSSEVPSEIRNVPYSIGRKGASRSMSTSAENSAFHHSKDITRGTTLAMSHYQPNFPLGCEPWYNLPVKNMPYHPSALPSRSFINPDTLPYSGLHNEASYHPNFLARNYSNYSVFSQYHQFPKQPCDLKEPITYEIFVEGLPENVSPNDVFCMVPGRLGMPNQGKKHQVLVGEILRRVLAPESLNISLLGPILRKAKSKNGSKFLRQKLNQIGVELPQGRRKTAQCTLFTSLTESEATQLADDFSKLNELSFPAKSLAARAVCDKASESIPLSPEAYQDTIKLLDGFAALLSAKSTTCNNGEKTSTINDATSQQLYNFDTLTHGFGSKAILSSLNTFRTYITRMADLSNLDNN